MTFTSKSLVISSLLLSLGLAGCQNTTPLSQSEVAPVSSTVAKNITQTQSNYADVRTLTIAGQALPVSETSARLLVNAEQTQPELVADIFDGKAKTAVPGYQILLINRTNSVAAEGRVMKDGSIIDNRMIHRGSKALVGIPVVNGTAMLAQAQLLDLDIIYDDPAKALAEGEVVKPRGTKLTKEGVSVTNKKVTVQALTLPNFASGESAGGGVRFEASALVDGKPVTTSADSAFQIFYTATPDNAKGF